MEWIIGIVILSLVLLFWKGPKLKIKKRRSHKKFGFIKINRTGVTGITSITSKLPFKRTLYWWQRPRKSKNTSM